jgi:hypothetical protein
MPTICCPHCDHEIDMGDSDIYPRHTTYWGEGGPTADECPKCERPFYIREHVVRTWHVGVTCDAAEDAVWK